MFFTENLQELNDTGSFPEESDKTPMCFVKCYLEALGVISNDGIVNGKKAVEMYHLKSDDLVVECKSEVSKFILRNCLICFLITLTVHLASASVSDECERAYFFARCIMTRSLLSDLGRDNDDS